MKVLETVKRKEGEAHEVSKSGLSVMIIGGGIGGLALAQGLQKHGIAVSVFERDEQEPAGREGYRLNIDPHGAAALHRCLPATLFHRFISECGQATESFSFLDQNLKTLVSFRDRNVPTDETAKHRSASRKILRSILLEGLRNVHFNKRFERYQLEEECVRAFFSDGSSFAADLLVGADGSNSGVAAQFLPGLAGRVKTGVEAIAGRTPLTQEIEAMLPVALQNSPGAILGTRRYGMFIAPHRFPEKNQSDYVMWALSAHAEDLRAAGPTKLQSERVEPDGEELQSRVLQMIPEWDSRVRKIVQSADEASVMLLTIFTSRPVPSWNSGRVTLLGDAIHSMTPMRGIGANIALRDAETLLHELVAAVKRGSQTRADNAGRLGGAEIASAARSYEHKMREYARPAVQESLEGMERFVNKNRFARFFTRLIFRILSVHARILFYKSP